VNLFMPSICITVMGVLSSEKWPFPRPALSGRRIVHTQAFNCGRISAARIAFAAIELRSPEATKANKNQQVTAGGLSRSNKHQQKSTQFNRVSKSQQKSAKSVPVHERGQQKSAIVSKSQHIFVLVRKQLRVFVRADSGYWNIKECVTGGPGTSYRFLLQTALWCGIYIYHSDTLLPPSVRRFGNAFTRS
jgi:hypothetical protein